jgi:hypothetical protein
MDTRKNCGQHLGGTCGHAVGLDFHLQVTALKDVVCYKYMRIFKCNR